MLTKYFQHYRSRIVGRINLKPAKIHNIAATTDTPNNFSPALLALIEVLPTEASLD
jgi:hypothetical protein